MACEWCKIVSCDRKLCRKALRLKKLLRKYKSNYPVSKKILEILDESEGFEGMHVIIEHHGCSGLFSSYYAYLSPTSTRRKGLCFDLSDLEARTAVREIITSKRFTYNGDTYIVGPNINGFVRGYRLQGFIDAGFDDVLRELCPYSIESDAR